MSGSGLDIEVLMNLETVSLKIVQTYLKGSNNSEELTDEFWWLDLVSNDI